MLFYYAIKFLLCQLASILFVILYLIKITQLQFDWN